MDTPRPIQRPIPMVIRRTSRRLAPIAIRIPICRVWRTRVQALSPYTPRITSTKADAGEGAEQEEAEARLRVGEPLEVVGDRSDVRDCHSAIYRPDLVG